MSISGAITRIQNNIASAYTGLEAKGATLPQTKNSANLRSAIDSIPQGNDDVTEKDVNFYDWDGTLLYSYTKNEAMALTMLPTPAVTHEYLIFQDWNRTLASIKAWLQAHPHNSLSVGANYTTTDGQSHNYWINPRLNSSSAIYICKFNESTMSTGLYENNYVLSKISIPHGLVSVSSYAFTDCRSLKHINLPEGLNSIGTYAFSGCSSLKSVTLPDNITYLYERAFSGSALTSVVLPDNMISIGGYAFANCYCLTSVVLPERTTIIAERAFAGCSSLSEVVFSDRTQTISRYAFSSCSSLSSVALPENLTNIGEGAFYYSQSLVDIVIKGTPTLANVNAFDGIASNFRIYVPESSIASFYSTATNWSSLYSDNRIVAIEDNIDYLTSIGIDVSAYEEE